MENFEGCAPRQLTAASGSARKRVEWSGHGCQSHGPELSNHCCRLVVGSVGTWHPIVRVGVLQRAVAVCRLEHSVFAPKAHSRECLTDCGDRLDCIVSAA